MRQQWTPEDSERFRAVMARRAVESYRKARECAKRDGTALTTEAQTLFREAESLRNLAGIGQDDLERLARS